MCVVCGVVPVWRVKEILVVNTNNITAITTRGITRRPRIFSRVVVTDHARSGYSTVIGTVNGPTVGATHISTSDIRRLMSLLGDCGPSVIVGLTLPCRSLAVVRTYLRANYGCLSATGCRPGSMTRFRCD